MSIAMTGIQSIMTVALEQRTQECVRILAEKYGFDAKEAISVVMSATVSESAPTKKQVAAEKKAAREEKKAKKADKPKRAPTGYILFGMDERATIKVDLPDLKGKDIMVEIARRWKLLDDDERYDWNSMAKTASVNESDNEEQSDDEQ